MRSFEMHCFRNMLCISTNSLNVFVYLGQEMSTHILPSLRPYTRDPDVLICSDKNLSSILQVLWLKSKKNPKIHLWKSCLLYSKVDKYYGKTWCKYLTAWCMWYNLKNVCVSIVQGSKRFTMQKLKTVVQKLEIQVPLDSYPPK